MSESSKIRAMKTKVISTGYKVRGSCVYEYRSVKFFYHRSEKSFVLFHDEDTTLGADMDNIPWYIDWCFTNKGHRNNSLFPPKGKYKLVKDGYGGPMLTDIISDAIDCQKSGWTVYVRRPDKTGYNGPVDLIAFEKKSQQSAAWNQISIVS